eukprot:5719655-Prymnesium_polylepis.1
MAKGRHPNLPPHPDLAAPSKYGRWMSSRSCSTCASPLTSTRSHSSRRATTIGHDPWPRPPPRP